MTDIALELLASTLKLALWAFIFYAALSAWKWSRKQKPGWREHIEFELGWEGLLPRVHYSFDSEERLAPQPETAAKPAEKTRDLATECRPAVDSVRFTQSEMYVPHSEIGASGPDAGSAGTQLSVSLPIEGGSLLPGADILEEAARWRYNRERTAS